MDSKVYDCLVSTAGYRIKHVAERSGFNAGTLRYYEQIGLLPRSGRTPAGYRIYDDRTLERLAFIARAKQLGCTLEEITGLTTAWDGGECGAIQDRLRTLVADKIDAAHVQIGELVTFTSDLQHAAAGLERHRPVGACDAECGCIADPASDVDATAPETAVMLSTKPGHLDDSSPIACTLAAGSINGRIQEWRSLLDHVAHREPFDGGVRCVFAETVDANEMMRLVSAEQNCCQFFSFTITVDSRGVALEVRAPDEAAEIITSMFGAAS